jgi:hypothetical protein
MMYSMFYLAMFSLSTSCTNRDTVSLFIFLEKTKQKIVVALESLCFQGRSLRQTHIRVINEKSENLL